ncbi:unnamed protein product [Polarella glacialis]|uniref:Uncharacterized protein n=1 Tax=Polarella glacialis TaxID=89957 RepID=A0A813IN21_POLGL|nr:unnamed protein product [Polarella glacialis]CAE8652397.1 unnamed protein product [Polarella glacialis]
MGAASCSELESPVDKAWQFLGDCSSISLPADLAERLASKSAGIAQNLAEAEDDDGDCESEGALVSSRSMGPLASAREKETTGFLGKGVRPFASKAGPVFGRRKTTNLSHITSRAQLTDLESVSKRLKEELLQAARHGNMKAVEAALVEGADVNCTTNRGQTPLMFAAGHTKHKGHEDIVSMLCAHKAELEAKDELGWTALCYAAGNHNFKATHLLVELKSDANAVNNRGRTPLMLGVSEMAPEVVKALVEAKGDIEAEDSDEWCPLFFAIELADLDMVKWLVKQKADCSTTSATGLTSLMMVALNGSACSKLAGHLIAHHAAVNALDKKGNTAMMLAIKEKKEELAECLCDEHRAELFHKNLAGEDAIEIAGDVGFYSLKGRLENRARKEQGIEVEDG